MIAKSQSLAIKLSKKMGDYGILFYRSVLSPYIGGQCRFTPSCSEYTRQAIENSGLLKGSLLGLQRLIKCTFWLGRGYAPAPSKK